MTPANPLIVRSRYLQILQDNLDLGMIEHLAEIAAAIEVEEELAERGEEMPERMYPPRSSKPLSEELEAGWGGMLGTTGLDRGSDG